MKKIGECLYIHKSNIGEFNSEILRDYIMLAIAKVPYDFNFAIIKFNNKNKTVTFIKSDNWDTAREPDVGDALKVDLKNNTVKFIKAKGQIYHHKWMFVDSNYNGFNVEESKQWSKTWQSVLPNTKEIKSKIGYKKYWLNILEQYNL